MSALPGAGTGAYQAAPCTVTLLSVVQRGDGKLLLLVAEGESVPGPVLLIGNPQSQGSADAFCAGLRRIAAGRPVLLLGDSVDPAFGERLGMPWLSLANGGTAELLSTLQRLLADAQRPERASPRAVQ